MLVDIVYKMVNLNEQPETYIKLVDIRIGHDSVNQCDDIVNKSSRNNDGQICN